jgi:hypothetical protein
MATYQSDAYMRGYIHRTIADQPLPVTASVNVPDGVALQAGDKLYLFRVGADHSIDEVIARFGALDRAQTATLTMNVGYEAAVAADDPDAFIAASTLPRAGGQVQVENGGDDPFAVGALAPIAETIDIVATVVASASSTAGSGAVGPAEDLGFITVTASVSRRVNAPDPLVTPYSYGD